MLLFKIFGKLGGDRLSVIAQTTSIRSGYVIPALSRTFVAVFAIICWVAPAHADQSQSFVWLADTRGNAPDDIIDTSVLTPIVNRILAMNPAPKVVIFGGDAAYRGGTTNLTQFQTVFTDRLTAAGIPSAYAIGNHELYTQGKDPPWESLTRQQEFQALFNGGWTQNGPAGFNNLAFSFHFGNSLFIIADSYYATANGVEPPYGINAAQQAWIKGLLQNNTAAHTFVLTHIPAYSPWVPSAENDMKDTWQTITTSGSATNTNASILFAGHEHLYYRTQHDGTYQVLAGTAGAPLGCATSSCGPVQSGDVYALSYNYAVVSTNGRYVTVTVYDQANNVLDSFQFFDNSGVNSSVISNVAPIVGPRPSGILAGSGNTISNSAAINDVDTGIDAVSNNTITNSGSITPSSGGNGITVYDNNRITNSGSITGNSTGLWGIRVGSGNTVVNQGTVAVAGTNSIGFLVQGDGNTLTNASTGILSASGTNSYAAMLVGTGNTLDNSGTISGNLWFDGGNNAFTNSGNYTGAITINGGKLSLSGDISSSSGITVNNGGTLGGTGTAPSVIINSGGTLAPGNSIGTLNVAGNVSFAAGSFYQVEINAAGQSDKTVATGTATLSGGTVQVLAQSGTYTPSTTYTILTASGVSGAFANVTSNFAFLVPMLSYDANDVFLTLTRSATAFASAAQTPNQFAVAHALDQFPSTNPLFLAVVNQTLAGGRQAFDALSGEVHASAQTAILNDSIFTRQAVLGRLRQAPFAGAAGPMAALGAGGPMVASANAALDDDDVALAYADASKPAARAFPIKAPPPMPPAVSPEVAVWAQGIGAWGKINSDGNAADARRNLAGFVSGIDRRFGDFWRAGIAAGYSSSSVSVGARASSANIDTAHLAAYAGASFDAWNFRTGAAFAWNIVDASRSILFPGFAEKATARYGVGEAQVFGEIGYGVAFGTIAAEPFAGLAWVHLDTASFTEAGGDSALTGTGTRDDVGYSTLGARAATNYLLPNGMALIPRASLAWQHAFGSVTPTSSLAFASTGIAFGVTGLPLARDAALVEAGFDLRIHPQATVGVSYSGQLADGAQDHSVKGNFVWRF